jgi:molecular chaperone GrpE (heat shock protein)
MQDYLDPISELRNANDRMDKLSIELIRVKQAITDTLPKFELYRQGVENEKRSIRAGYERLILRLIEILEDLQTQEKKLKKDANFRKYIKTNIEDVLSREGITMLPTKIGETFDPNKHTVLGTAKCGELKEGSIAEILKQGFKQQSRIVRKTEVYLVKENEK